MSLNCLSRKVRNSHSAFPTSSLDDSKSPAAKSRNRMSLLLSSRVRSLFLKMSSLLPGTDLITPDGRYIANRSSNLNPPYLATPDATIALIKGPTAGIIDGAREKEYCRPCGSKAPAG